MKAPTFLQLRDDFMTSKALAASTDRLIQIRINLFPDQSLAQRLRQQWSSTGGCWRKGISETAKELLQENVRARL